MVKSSDVKSLLGDLLESIENQKYDHAKEIINNFHVFLHKKRKVNKNIVKTIEKKKRFPTAYNLFVKSQVLSPEVQLIPSRERFSTVSQRWKNLSQEEKQKFHDLYISQKSLIENEKDSQDKDEEKEDEVVDMDLGSSIDLDLKNALDEAFQDE